MPTPFVAGNWKMNTTVREAEALAASLRRELDGLMGVEVALCPPFISLERVARSLEGSSLKMGAQNMHYEDKGAFTGEVSPAMLQGMCQLVILGHSERRNLFGETDELVNRKVLKALEIGLRPILCVGEHLEERQEGREEAVVSASLAACLEGMVSPEGLPGGLIVAYEPVWAIGTGLAATGEQAQAMSALIRRFLADRYGQHGAEAVPILYGGSVTPTNVAEFVSQPDIDGALVGGASLDAQQFAEIVHITAKVRRSP